LEYNRYEHVRHSVLQKPMSQARNRFFDKDNDLPGVVEVD